MALTPLDVRAARTLDALAQRVDLPAAARLGAFDERLVRVIAAAAAGDPRGPLSRLAPFSSEVGLLERSLTVALSWPFTMLVLTFGASLVLLRVGLPALARLPLGGAHVSPGPMLVALGALGVALLALVVLGRERYFTAVFSAWRALDAWALLRCTCVLTGAGVPLAQAVRAASEWCAPRLGARGLDFARSLEAGAPDAALLAPLVGPVQAAALAASASAGTVDATLDALAALAEAEARRALPRDRERVHLVALLLAGAAILTTAIAFYSTYVRAVTG
ncbi:MAG: type II secretion system F family protein [Myxococcota bacterium]